MLLLDELCQRHLPRHGIPILPFSATESSTLLMIACRATGGCWYKLVVIGCSYHHKMDWR